MLFLLKDINDGNTMMPIEAKAISFDASRLESVFILSYLVLTVLFPYG